MGGLDSGHEAEADKIDDLISRACINLALAVEVAGYRRASHRRPLIPLVKVAMVASPAAICTNRENRPGHWTSCRNEARDNLDLHILFEST